MSDSMFFPDEGSRTRGIKRLHAKVTFGSSSVSASDGTGVTVTRSAAGTYTATMDDYFVEFKGAEYDFNANSTTPVDLQPQTYAVDVTSAKTVKFKLLTGTTATDPSSGAELYLTLAFKDSSVT